MTVVTRKLMHRMMRIDLNKLPRMAPWLRFSRSFMSNFLRITAMMAKANAMAMPISAIPQ